jgi:nucleoside-diphosphate-sugar epimerase
MKLLLTGASGFVGKVLCDSLLLNNHEIAVASRNKSIDDRRVKTVFISALDGETAWEDSLKGIEAVVHLAARAHVLAETSLKPLDEFRKVNTQGTLHLANCAAKAGVKRFVFLSSIGVNGNKSTTPFNESSAPQPVEPYALSKLETEEGLRKIADDTGMEFVIVRPPLVYGPNCPGNFLALLRLVYRGIPLPFGTINNKRSLIGVHNLTDFLVQCVERSEAANKTFLIADDMDISTPDLMRVLAKAMSRPAFLFPMPYQLLYATAVLVGKASVLDKVSGTLQVDSSFARKTLGWNQPFPLYQGLEDAAVWYAASRSGK